jgi:putative lipoic acid-binding regulatory protein
MSKTRSLHPQSQQQHPGRRLGHKQLHSFFLECTHKSFWELGMGDQAVIEYVTDVLTTFARTDQLYRIRPSTGRRLSSVVEILAEQAEQTQSAQPAERAASTSLWRERQVRKHVGDYTLFMSGLFRAYVEKLGVMDYYLQEGRQSYAQVSELDVKLYQTGFMLFQELSKNFEYYSGALDYMRKAYFGPSPRDNSFGQFLRQVEGWVKTHLSDN